MLIGVDASRAFTEEKTGTENYSQELIQALLQLPEAKQHHWRLYVPTRSLLVGLQGDSSLETVEIPWPRLWTQGGLAFECLKYPPEVLFIPSHTLPVLRRPSLKTVVTIHGIEYEFLPEYYQFPQKLYLNKSTEYAVKHADRLIAVSNWTKKQLVERLGADPKKIFVIYEGINPKFTNFQFSIFKPDYLRQIRHKYGLPKNYILFVGTIQPRKNLVRLIEAFSRLITLRECELVIAGKLGWMYEEILSGPKKFGVQDRVKFIGRVADPDLPAVYKMAKLFVWPSLMEGFGLPILEAFSMGVPVVASTAGALPEIAGEAALLVEPTKVEDLTKAIKLVLENQELKEALVEKGYRQLAKFSWEKAAKKTLKVLTASG